MNIDQEPGNSNEPSGNDEPKQTRYSAMIRDTWWAWVILALFGIIGGILHPIFFIAIPISVAAFFYFAIMRYDEDGNPTGD